ncbi:MAG TPA: hypothetical protein VGD79_07425 [Thermoanaerobaculia bacterium]|jgi:hypothetical protein
MSIALLLLAILSADVHQWRAGGQASVEQLIANGAAEELLDAVCAQKDCRASQLYWYTDLEEAKAAAQRLKRPILSLYLLGRLDEELSCANSRFFRVLLYSDPAIAKVMREEYVLYWHSVRPVPQVTIDMGDGRKIRQTITGNSVHYLLDADGRVLDALPGLHSPKAFREQLEEWLTLDRAKLREYHAARSRGPFETPSKKASALDASRLATTKGIVELPLLRQLTLGSRTIEVNLNLGDDVAFSKESIALMETKQPLNDELLKNLRRAVVADTYVNGEMHAVIHQWFATGEVRDLDSLNERVYAELFRTPSDDPWLGLNPSAAFAAIEEGGRGF